MNESESKIISLQIEEELLKKAKARAKSLGLSFSAYVRFLVAKELEKGSLGE